MHKTREAILNPPIFYTSIQTLFDTSPLFGRPDRLPEGNAAVGFLET